MRPSEVHPRRDRYTASTRPGIDSNVVGCPRETSRPGFTCVGKDYVFREMRIFCLVVRRRYCSQSSCIVSLIPRPWHSGAPPPSQCLSRSRFRPKRSAEQSGHQSGSLNPFFPSLAQPPTPPHKRNDKLSTTGAVVSVGGGFFPRLAIALRRKPNVFSELNPNVSPV